MAKGTTEYKPTRVVDDEIEFDMISILRAIYRGVSNAFRYLINVFKRNFLLLLICTILGGIVGFAGYKTTKPYFTSSMTLVLADIRNEFVEDQLEKLTQMIEDDNFGAISQRLDISETAARDIKKMSFFNLDQERIAEDSILRGSPFRIEVSLYNNNLFDSLEPAITNYLESNRFFNKQKLIRQRQIQSMVSKYKSDISSIDSVKNTVTSPRGPVNGFVYGEPIDPTNLYRESIDMYKEQVNLEAELDQLDNIQVVNGFSPRIRPSGPNVIKYVGLGMVAFFAIGFTVALFKKSKV
ncbi:chain length determinant protein [uncultured Pontibacter sp.]|uniref:chain length determinant protein n=1 Tax=uncultured Pontibacter sp. TaxID=453356 RepID=UPI002605A643|nr:chain length determinant protein [uncultured Pontibacter sp.]